MLKEPPYQVSESGYAGFNLPIDIYFKNKEEPRKIHFKYDLFLHNEGCPPVNHIRCEKLTFQNPTEDFRRKLIKAGGVSFLELYIYRICYSYVVLATVAIKVYDDHNSISRIDFEPHILFLN